MHHAHLPLYGSAAGDAAACAVALLAAGTTGTLRVVSDNHYASDVLLGAAIGLGSGLGLPWLLHYRGGATQASSDARRPGASIGLLPGFLSGTLVGTF